MAAHYGYGYNAHNIPQPGDRDWLPRRYLIRTSPAEVTRILADIHRLETLVEHANEYEPHRVPGSDEDIDDFFVYRDYRGGPSHPHIDWDDDDRVATLMHIRNPRVEFRPTIMFYGVRNQRETRYKIRMVVIKKSIGELGQIIIQTTDVIAPVYTFFRAMLLNDWQLRDLPPHLQIQNGAEIHRQLQISDDPSDFWRRMADELVDELTNMHIEYMREIRRRLVAENRNRLILANPPSAAGKISTIA